MTKPVTFELLPKACGPVKGGREFANRDYRGSNALTHFLPKTSSDLSWAIGKFHTKDGRHDAWFCLCMDLTSLMEWSSAHQRHFALHL